MDPMVFQFVGTHPLPMLSQELDGTLHPADGATWFSAAQAAEKLGMNEQVVRDMWRRVWRPAIARSEAQMFDDEADEPVSPIAPDDLESLRELEFPHLEPRYFDQVIRFCRRRSIDPWAMQVWAEVKRDVETTAERLIIRMKWEGIRALAHRTGEFAGNKVPRFTFTETEDARRRPDTCTFTVYRMVNGVRRAFRGVAIYEDCYVPGEWWDRRPLFMMRKTAEIDSLRLAFPEVLGCVQEKDDSPLRRTDSVRRPAPAAPAGSFGGPADETEFVAELVTLGLHDPDHRNGVVRSLKRRFNALLGTPALFYKRAITAIRSDPASFGIVADVV